MGASRILKARSGSCLWPWMHTGHLIFITFETVLSVTKTDNEVMGVEVPLCDRWKNVGGSVGLKGWLDS